MTRAPGMNCLLAHVTIATLQSGVAASAARPPTAVAEQPGSDSGTAGLPGAASDGVEIKRGLPSGRALFFRYQV